MPRWPWPSWPRGRWRCALTGPLWLAFLAWQRDLGAVRRVRAGQGLLLGALIILPWYVAAGVRGGAAYAYEMVVHQNLERALHAWDHIQPPWKYVEYLAGDFFPWTLLLPSLALFLRRSGAHRQASGRFLMLAVAVPFLLLSCSQSKQGKYLLMVVPVPGPADRPPCSASPGAGRPAPGAWAACSRPGSACPPWP